MFPLSALNVFGAATVSVMMLAYAAEGRGSTYTMIFGVSSLGASAYGWLSGTWPFGVIEFVWALISFNKWRKLKKGEQVVS